jgi:hypothetical protein
MITVKPMVMTEFAAGRPPRRRDAGPDSRGADAGRRRSGAARRDRPADDGLPGAEAREFAKKVDWKTTLVVPVRRPRRGSGRCLVGSSQGVAIEGPIIDPETKVERGNWNLLLWSNGGRVYGIRSTLRFNDVLAMANSLQ